VRRKIKERKRERTNEKETTLKNKAAKWKEYPHEVMLDHREGQGEKEGGQSARPIIDCETVRIDSFKQTKQSEDKVEPKFVIQIFDLVCWLGKNRLQDPQEGIEK
jgi:hypothetical protein